MEKIKEQEKATIAQCLEACKRLERQNLEIEVFFKRFKRLSFEIDKKDRERVESLSTALKNMSTEILIEKRQTISFEDATKRALVYLYGVAVLIMGICIGLVFYAYHYEYAPKAKNQAQEQWIWDYAEHMRKKNPKTHQQYISEYPFPN